MLAPTTGMRKEEILSRTWSDIDLDSGNPCVYVRETKNDEPKRIQLPDMAVTALRALPSYGRHEYVFPAKPNSRFKAVPRLSVEQRKRIESLAGKYLMLETRREELPGRIVGIQIRLGDTLVRFSACQMILQYEFELVLETLMNAEWFACPCPHHCA